MRQILIFTIITFIVFVACKEKKTEFIYLDKISGGFNPEYYVEEVLIDNAPKDIRIRDSMVWAYFIAHRVDFCKLDSNVIEYSMSFYHKTSCTSYFIDHAYEGGGSTIYNENDDWDPGCHDDEISFFFYHRSKENPQIWFQTYPSDCHDTIRCE